MSYVVVEMTITLGLVAGGDPVMKIPSNGEPTPQRQATRPMGPRARRSGPEGPS